MLCPAFVFQLTPRLVARCANNGTCTATGFQCNCPPAWAGQRCELALLETPPPPSAVAAAAAPASSPPGTVAVPNWVAAPIVVGALLLLCLVACVAALVVRERRGAPIFAPLLERGALSSSSRARELAAHAAAAVHGPGADKV